MRYRSVDFVCTIFACAAVLSFSPAVVAEDFAEGLRTNEQRAGYDWWSLRPLPPVSVPENASAPAEWRKHPIDRFIYAKLAERDLHPAGPADPRTLIRRATYDLTGLPPSPENVEAFLDDCQSETGQPDEVGQVAYAQLIDRLLSSSHYGEQWGRHWLDVVRFGESNGYERNVLHRNLWPYRDYVIQSLNDDKPFDRFVLEHLAGDVVAPGDPEVAVGTTFLICGPYDNVGNQDAVAAAQIRADAIDEMIRATSGAFLGLTVGCSRCHDHKFDPISQRDYYQLYATFAGVRHNSGALVGAEAQEDKPVEPPQPWLGHFHAADGPFHVFDGGSPQRPTHDVAPASMNFLAETTRGYQLASNSPEHLRRFALAQWLVAPDNPLTPRVLANRVWHYHFGTGLVRTPSDFGFLGGKPSHPQLLDWLATELKRNGWRLKPLHRQIMLSQTYRQASMHRADAAKVDGEVRLLWRFPSRRLSAEEVRDTLLAVAGKLDTTMGGPGFRLFRYVQDNVATYYPLDVHGADTFRRAVYHHHARATQIDLMTEYDMPDCAFATPRRSQTTTPLQALTMLNHQFTMDMANAMATRVEHDVGSSDVTEQVTRAFHLAFVRKPTAEELDVAHRLASTHGMPAVTRALLNSSELIYLD